MVEEQQNPPDKASLRVLRVLHVVSGDLWAGAEVQVFQVVRALRDLPGIEPRVAVMNPGTLAERLAAEGIQVDVLDERTYGFVALTSRLTNLARAWHPDIIHTHRRKEHIIGGIVATRSRIGTVATIHGRSEFVHPWWKLRHSVLRFLERLVLRTIHQRLIAVSDEVGSALPGPRSHVIVIPNGIAIDDARARATQGQELAPSKDDERIIGFVGRLVPVKQVDRIIDTLEILRRDTPLDWRLRIIGDGPLREPLEHQARRKGMEDKVEFTGFLTEPLPTVSGLDALVFASLHEGLPMTALEALALGVPIVAPPLGGLTQLIRESGRGIIAPSTEPADLAGAVIAALERFGLHTHDRPSHLPPRYNVASAAQELMAIYRGL